MTPQKSEEVIVQENGLDSFLATSLLNAGSRCTDKLSKFMTKLFKLET